jgi:hypothetical protein
LWCQHYSGSLLPIGELSEEAQEARNKDYKKFRLSHTRFFSIFNFKLKLKIKLDNFKNVSKSMNLKYKHAKSTPLSKKSVLDLSDNLHSLDINYI